MHGNDAPTFKLNYTISVVQQALIMGGDDASDACGMKGLQHVHHASSAVAVKISGGLIGEDDARLMDDGARNRDTLLLATG
jgi:hypothetical protein